MFTDGGHSGCCLRGDTGGLIVSFPQFRQFTACVLLGAFLGCDFTVEVVRVVLRHGCLTVQVTAVVGGHTVAGAVHFLHEVRAVTFAVFVKPVFRAACCAFEQGPTHPGGVLEHVITGTAGSSRVGVHHTSRSTTE